MKLNLTIFAALTVLMGSVSFAAPNSSSTQQSVIRLTKQAAACLKSVQAEGHAIICQSLNEVKRNTPTLILALVGGRRLIAQRQDVAGIQYKVAVNVSNIRYVPAELTIDGVIPDSVEVVGRNGESVVGMRIACGQNLDAIIASRVKKVGVKSDEYLQGICSVKKL